MNVEILLYTALGTFIFFELLSRGAMTWRLWREVARIFILMELASLRLVRLVVKPRYVLTGGCHKRGTCCEWIVGDPPRVVKQTALLRLFVAYHRLMHDFHLVGRGEAGEVIFSCGHLRGDGRCGIYRYRPFLCRNYPVQPFFEPPRPIPGCGYGIAPRAVAEMKRRDSLPIVNPVVAVHHPTRSGGRDRFDQPEDYELVDPSPESPRREPRP